MLTKEEIKKLESAHLTFSSLSSAEPTIFTFLFNNNKVQEEVKIGYVVNEKEIYLFIHPDGMEEEIRKELSESARKLHILLKNHPFFRLKIATGDTSFFFDPKIIIKKDEYEKRLDETYMLPIFQTMKKNHQYLLSYVRKHEVTYSSFLIQKGFSSFFATGEDFKLLLDFLVQEKIIRVNSYSSNFFRFELTCFQNISTKQYLFMKENFIKSLKEKGYSVW